MAEENYPQPPQQTQTQQVGNRVNPDNIVNVAPQAAPGTVLFPTTADQYRLNDYDYYRNLFLGHHFEAFRIKIDDERYNRAYNKLRYVMVNFAGLISKVMADMLFTEPIVVKVPDGDQDFIDGLWYENKMDMQCYESALSNSYYGDALFKLRVGKRSANDEDSSIIIEDTTPKIYFPKLDGFNVRAEPSEVDLAWTFRVGNLVYLRKEIHTPGKIVNKVYRMEGNKVMEEVDPSVVGIGLKPEEETGIDELMVVHTPNWKTGDRHFGLSDYHDLDSLFYAINNRMTKVDNILDKHGDPILSVPPGILDDKGQVKKKALGVIEVEPGTEGKPEYIVWDASLDSAFKEIEKTLEFMYLVGEIAPDLLGMGQGVSESGRALKFKLMRTLAKTQRKRLYYDYAIKEVLYRAQVLAKEHGLKINGKTLQGDPVVPEIDWKDGLPIDTHEQQDDEIKAIDAGITSKKAAIMRLYNVDEKAADKMLADIDKEKPAITLPTMNLGGKPNDPNNAQGNMNKNMPMEMSDKSQNPKPGAK